MNAFGVPDDGADHLAGGVDSEEIAAIVFESLDVRNLIDSSDVDIAVDVHYKI